MRSPRACLNDIVSTLSNVCSPRLGSSRKKKDMHKAASTNATAESIKFSAVEPNIYDNVSFTFGTPLVSSPTPSASSSPVGTILLGRNTSHSSLTSLGISESSLANSQSLHASIRDSFYYQSFERNHSAALTPTHLQKSRDVSVSAVFASLLSKDMGTVFPKDVKTTSGTPGNGDTFFDEDTLSALHAVSTRLV